MSDLADQMRRARESQFPFRNHTFTIRTPVRPEVRAKRNEPPEQQIASCVVGWSGVKVSDLVPDGTVADAPFDGDALYEWLSSDDALFLALLTEVNRLVEKRVESQEADEKN